MFILAILYLLYEVRVFFKDMHTKRNMRSLSNEFTDIMQTLFALRNPFDIVDCLDKSCECVDEYVRTVLCCFAPELEEHYKKFFWVLMARKRLVRTSDMDDSAQECYRYFMCVVMQLRVYGELHSQGTMDKFKASFRGFVELRALHLVAQRTWTVAMEMRRIANELDKIDELDESNTELLQRFSHALDDVRELIGQE